MDKRVILIVMDSAGIGEMPDANRFHDEGSDTFGNIYKNVSDMSLPNLEKLGLGLIDSVSEIIPKVSSPIGAYSKMSEASNGKDTTTGHWEMGGIITETPFATFPNGFDEAIIKQYVELVGHEPLCNKVYSGTQLLKDYGEEHIKTKRAIVYTSADSVFQIAAHEDVIALEELYEICTKMRKVLDNYNVGRVIARPFIGTNSEDFTRTTNRRDFSLVPQNTMLNNIVSAGLPVMAVGKIEDIFAGSGITDAVHTVSNLDGVDKTLDYMKNSEKGLIFTNLVDFDSLYGHRNNYLGYAKALAEFDTKLKDIMGEMRDNDILMITADHGCDPTTKSTDHSREYVPLLVYGKKVKPINLGIRKTFADIGASICDYLGASTIENGESFIPQIIID